VEVKEDYQAKISNSFAALGKLDDDDDDDVDMSGVPENVREDKNFRHRVPILLRVEKITACFNEQCSKLLNQRKQAKLQ